MPGERFVVGVTDNIPDETFVHGESCVDIKGRTIFDGHQYVPGPDSCTVCHCDGGKPKWCQAVLCAAPKGCNSFRIGNSCCEFICLDNAHGVHGEGSVDISWGEEQWVTGDLGVRLVASSVTAILSLALLAFLFYRLRRRRLRRLAALELESGVGAGAGSMASLGGIHGDLTSSMGHLSRQLPSMVPDGESPSPIYLMWKQPSSVPDVPPNTKSTSTVNPRSEQDEDYHERIGLLALPTAPVITDQLRCSSDTLNSDALGRGTPPPSYAEVLASISVNQVNQSFAEENGPIPNDVLNSTPAELTEEIHENPPTQDQQQQQQQQQQQWRLSLPLPRDRAHDSEAAIQRFSLQLALDWSDTNSSSSSSLSQVQPLSSSSSSSATSLGPSNLT